MTYSFKSKLSPVIGLSAPQIGHSLKIIAYQITDAKLLKEHQIKNPIPLTFLINPIIKNPSVKQSLEREYCESIPHYSAMINRSESIQVEALDLEGKKVVRKYKGLLARIIQHGNDVMIAAVDMSLEMDHLEGICFTDRMEKSSLRHDDYIDKFEMIPPRNVS